MYREYETELLTEQTYYDDYPVSEPRFDLVRADKRLSVGILGDLMDYISLLSIEDEMGSCRFVLPEQEGGAIFIPYTMIGMSSAAKAEEQASRFYPLSVFGRRSTGRSIHKISGQPDAV